MGHDIKFRYQCDSLSVPLKNVCRRVVNYSQCLCQNATAAAFPLSLSLSLFPHSRTLRLSLLVLSSYVTGQLAFRYVARGRRHFTWTLFKVGKLVNFSTARARASASARPSIRPRPADGLPSADSPAAAAGAWPFRRNLDCFREPPPSLSHAVRRPDL